MHQPTETPSTQPCPSAASTEDFEVKKFIEAKNYRPVDQEAPALRLEQFREFRRRKNALGGTSLTSRPARVSI